MTEPTAGPTPAPDAPSADARVMDAAIRLGFLALFAWISLQLVAPFLVIVVWAVVLAVALQPAHAALARRLGARGASIVIVGAGLAILLGPVAVLVVSLAQTAQHLAAGLADGSLTVPPPPDGVRGWPLIGAPVHDAWALAAGNLEAALRQAGPYLIDAGGVALSAVAGVGGGVLGFAVSVVLAGFLFKPGPTLAAAGRRFAVRVVGARGDGFVDMAGATIRNVSRGVIGVAVLQALAGGVVMAAAGVPGAGLLAFVALLLAIVQIGPGPVFVGAIIWAWGALGLGGAALFTLVMVPIMLSDNVLKPMLMARGLAVPMLVILIGVLGGTLSYGLIGLFLGPIVLSVFYELLVAWVGRDGASDGA